MTLPTRHSLELLERQMSGCLSLPEFDRHHKKLVTLPKLSQRTQATGWASRFTWIWHLSHWQSLAHLCGAVTYAATWTKPGSVCFPVEASWTIYLPFHRLSAGNRYFYWGRQVLFSERSISSRVTGFFVCFLLKNTLLPSLIQKSWMRRSRNCNHAE